MYHSPVCTCPISAQAYRILSAMCSTVAVYKEATREPLTKLDAELDDLTKNQTKDRYEAIHKDALELCAAEMHCVNDAYAEYDRLCNEHIEAVKNDPTKYGGALENSGMPPEVQELLKRILGLE